MSAANIYPNLFDQNRTVSGQRSISRSNSRSCTFRTLSGNRTYSIITSPMISGDESIVWMGYLICSVLASNSPMLAVSIRKKCEAPSSRRYRKHNIPFDANAKSDLI